MTSAQSRRKPGETSRRTCIGCRRPGDPSSLVRLTRSPEGEVVVDHPSRLGGRGAWVCPSAKCIARASRGRALSRSLRGELATVSVEALTAQVRGRLESRVDGLLSAAGRARKVVVGASETLEAIAGGGACIVVVARDGSPRVLKDLEAAAQRAGVRVFHFGDRDRLGLAMARSVVAAIALVDEGLAAALERELRLLAMLDAESAETTRNLSPRLG